MGDSIARPGTIPLDRVDTGAEQARGLDAGRQEQREGGVEDAAPWIGLHGALL